MMSSKFFKTKIIQLFYKVSAFLQLKGDVPQRVYNRFLKVYKTESFIEYCLREP